MAVCRLLISPWNCSAAFLPSAAPVTARSKSITAILLAPTGTTALAVAAAGFEAGAFGTLVAGGFAGVALVDVAGGAAGVCANNVAVGSSVMKSSELARFILIASNSRDC